MLRHFIITHRDEILAQAQSRVTERGNGHLQEVGGLPTFLEQLEEALRKATRGEIPNHNEIQQSASKHGEILFHKGRTIAQVVHDYGDLCQVISGLCAEHGAHIDVSEFKTLNLCLDDAIAGAVTEYAKHRERAISEEGTERLGILAHEMRNVLASAILSFGSVKKGVVATGGVTSAMVDRSHARLSGLIDRSLAEVRLETGLLHIEQVPLHQIFEEIEIVALLIAQTGKRNVNVTVTPVSPTIIVEVDRLTLVAAISNLVQNAIKFTKPNSTVQLRATTTPTRILIEVEDECGGLPDGSAETLLKPFVQKGRDRTGLGLGLAICVRAARAMSGELRISDLPDKGCIFTLDLPKK